MPRINIKNGTGVFGAIIALGFMAVLYSSHCALSALRIGGPVYQDISRSRELVEDVMPPPIFITEAYLEVTLALESPDSLALRRIHLAQMHKSYIARRAYWNGQPIDPGVKAMLVQQSDRQVQDFWRIVDTQLLPALTRGDMPAARRAYAGIQSAFIAHKAIVQEIVTASRKLQRKTELDAERKGRVFFLIVVIVAIAVMAMLVAAIAWLSLRVVQPLCRMTDSMTHIARHDYSGEVEGAQRHDEIGDMARAVTVFRNGMLEAERLKSELVDAEIDKRAAQDASRAKSAFLANMSHELRTPLNAIIGFSDMMTMQMFGTIPARYLEYTGLINSSGKHLLDVITNILDMAKVEAGKFDLKFESIDLEQVVAECIQIVTPAARARNAQLTASIAASLALQADRRALRQILLNILSNAVKFGHEFGHIDVRAMQDRDRAVLEVRDDGIGIPAEHLERLGRPFEQVTQDANIARGGTGLGLALVHAMVSEHGGTVQIESRHGEGTCVRIILPLQAARQRSTT